MINQPHVEHGIELLKTVPDLAVGLHVTLDTGEPVATGHTTLIDKTSLLRHRDCLRNAREDDIEKEVVAQYRKAKNAGLNITHLDSHHHIHMCYPRVTKVFEKLSRGEGLPVRWTRDKEEFTMLAKFVKVSQEEKKVSKLYFDRIRRRILLSAKIMSCDYRKSLNYMLKTVFSSTDRLIIDFFDDNATAGFLFKSIFTMESGDSAELMCHPAIVDDELLKTPYAEQRERELEILTSDEVASYFKESNVELVTYSDI